VYGVVVSGWGRGKIFVERKRRRRPGREKGIYKP
jgi:hypothetical protein